jgi:hypothetical protein
MMRRPAPRADRLDAEVRDEVVAFLRDWIPHPAKEMYREMIARDPEGWHLHPHFAGGVIVQHALRGNGIDEVALGIADLDPLWPELLRLAIAEDASPPRSAAAE